MVSLMGAHFSKSLRANEDTHLICYKFEGTSSEFCILYTFHWTCVAISVLHCVLISLLISFCYCYYVGPFRDVSPSVQCITLAILRLISPPFSYKRCQHVDLWALLVVVCIKALLLLLLVVVCIDNTNFNLSFVSLVWLHFNKNTII